MSALPSVISFRVGSGVSVGDESADTWWEVANTGRRGDLVRMMGIRHAAVFDATGTGHAWVDVFGVEQLGGGRLKLHGSVRSACPPKAYRPRAAVQYFDTMEVAQRSTKDVRALAATWRSWEQRYEMGEHLFGRAPADWLGGEMAKIPPGSRVLVLGAGEGRNALHLAEAEHVVTALDLSAVAIRRFREEAAQAELNVEAFVGDAERWLDSSAADQRWDVAVLNYFNAGGDAANMRVLKALRERCASLIAEFARAIVGSDVVLASWGQATLSYAEAKVPALRVHMS